ncbi:MAG: PEGA domain-containing protein [Alphaproteobacteria bacterium]
MKKLFLFPVLFALSACGTLFSGQEQTILIDSSPSEVEIYHNGRLLGKTPLTAKLERTGNPVMLTAKKENYNNQTLMLNTTFSAGALLDGVFAIALITGTTGFTTDASNETIWAYTPNQFFVDMVKTGEENRPENKLKIFITKNFDTLHLEAANNGGPTLQALSLLTGQKTEILIPAVLSSSYPSDLIHILQQ